jgi:uncharacterized protein (DUF488 family)
MAASRLFTVGYEGRTVAEFVAALVGAGIGRVVDVRELPLSRRKGFSKTKLSEALAVAGIEYVHLRAAGNPYRDERHDIEGCLKKYRGYIDGRPDVIDELKVLSSDNKTALLCVEADAARCHRSVLVEKISRRSAGLQVQHL